MYTRGALAFVYAISYFYLVYRAADDHQTLPYARYRLTYMFIRVQVLQLWYCSP